MYIYNQKDTICYFIQYENPGQIKLITPKNIFYDKKNRTLSITNEDNTIEVFQHNNNIYGIGKINAELSSSLFKDMVFTRSNENYYDNSNYYEPDDVAAIKCGCIKETAKQKPTNCESGGEGSTQCGITDGGGVATMSWGHQCEVSCKSGYYSCCTTSNKFVY